jgi:hypothetical protein
MFSFHTSGCKNRPVLHLVSGSGYTPCKCKYCIYCDNCKNCYNSMPMRVAEGWRLANGGFFVPTPVLFLQFLHFRRACLSWSMRNEQGQVSIMFRTMFYSTPSSGCTNTLAALRQPVAPDSRGNVGSQGNPVDTRTVDSIPPSCCLSLNPGSRGVVTRSAGGVLRTRQKCLHPNIYRHLFRS